MKLLTYSPASQPDEDRLALLSGEDGCILPLEQFGLNFPDMSSLIGQISPQQLDMLRRAGQAGNLQCLRPKDYILRSPIPHPLQDVICLGINYAAHAEESARYKKETFERNRAHAVYFSKRASFTPGDGDTVSSHADVTQKMDYEAELAVIIGKKACSVPASQAFDYVFGYTILNDFSARDLQTNHKQWYFAKSLDGFCPMGPYLVTEDEFERPPVLGIRSFVNGELRQNSNTGLLLFDIPAIIEELSSAMTLLPGTIISTGTPAGVGMGFDPPKFLKPGDTVRCEIDGIGSLTNTVV